VLAVAVCRAQGGVVLRIQKSVERFVGGRMIVEVTPPWGWASAVSPSSLVTAHSTTMYAMTTLYPSDFTYFILVD